MIPPFLRRLSGNDWAKEARTQDNRQPFKRVDRSRLFPISNFCRFLETDDSDIYVATREDRLETIFFDAQRMSKSLMQMELTSKPLMRVDPQRQRVDSMKQIFPWIKSGEAVFHIWNWNNVKAYSTRHPGVYTLAHHYITSKVLDFKQVGAVLKLQNDAYHSGKAESIFTDAEFDGWKEIFEAYEEPWPLDGTVGAPERSKDKVKLPNAMGSLEKCQTVEEIQAWARKNSIDEFVVTPKIDGSSTQLQYGRARLEHAFTRGDGENGRDVTRNVQHIPSVPKVLRGVNIMGTGEHFIRGEIVIPQRTFNSQFSNDFENARNMVAGILNRSKPDTRALGAMIFYAFEEYGASGSKSDRLEALDKRGFKVVPFKVLRGVKQLAKLDEILEEFQQRVPTEMDGLVVEANSAKDAKRVGLETNSINPKYARAYKPPRLDKGNLAKTSVRKVEWSVSRHGFLKPVIIVDPVKLAGATVRRATAFNAAFVKDNKVGPGARVVLTRSGDVIPFIVKVIRAAEKPSLPSKKEFGDYDWNETGVDLIVTDADNNDAIQLERITHFFEACGVERLKSETLKAFVKAGFDTIQKIVAMKRRDITRIDRMGDTVANNILKEFEKLKSVPMHTLMYASNCFGRNFGSRKLKVLVAKFGRKVLDWNGMSIKEVAAKIAKVDGFSYETGRQFAQGIMPFNKFLRSVRPHVEGVYPAAAKSNGKCKGTVVCFTGFRDSALAESIEKEGGTISSGVSSRTTHLLVATKTSGSDKATKARALGVKIMTADEFKGKFKL